MNYQLLGNTGLRVSELCLGTMTFGEDWGWGADRATSQKIYQRFIDQGGNFIDTADAYTNGTSEKFLGDFMEGHRPQVVLATKYTDEMNPDNKDPNAAGNSRKNMMQSVEASLKRLKTDYIDLLWVHAWDFMTPVREVMRGLDDLVRQGKVLYIGISDAPAWVIAEANMLADLRGLTPLAAMQLEYNLVERTPERELLPYARARNLTAVGWSPLASGILTGKYSKKNGKNEGGRLDEAPFKAQSDENLAIGDAVVEMAQEMGVSPSQLAINWVRQRGVIPILGARTEQHFEDNMGVLDFTIPEEQMNALNELSSIELGFPLDFLAQTRNATYGSTYDLIKSSAKSIFS